MVSKPIMASLSATSSNKKITHSNQFSQTSFTFAVTVNLDRSNFLLLCKQVLTSIRGNLLKELISEPLIIPEQYLSDLTGEHKIEHFLVGCYPLSVKVF